MMATQVLNLDVLTDNGRVKNLAGKERGQAARQQLKIDELDTSPDVIEIIVPAYVDTISPSFFQGLFSGSIQRLAGKAGFLQKYRFSASEQARQWIDLGIRNATVIRRTLIQ